MKCAVLSLLILVIFSTCSLGNNDIIGRYKLSPSPGDTQMFSLLQELGYNDIMCLYISSSPIEIEISERKSKYKLQYNVGDKSQSLTFQDGVELEETILDGRKCKSIYKVKNQKIVRSLSCGSKKSIDYADFSTTGMNLTRTTGSHVVLQIFKRV